MELFAVILWAIMILQVRNSHSVWEMIQEESTKNVVQLMTKWRRDHIFQRELVITEIMILWCRICDNARNVRVFTKCTSDIAHLKKAIYELKLVLIWIKLPKREAF